MSCYHFTHETTRRGMLQSSACGFGHLALAALAARSAAAATTDQPGPLAAEVPHLTPRARRVIFLFMWGGPSHVDLFDPKPRLNSQSGKTLSLESFGLEPQM
jgi:hypothetical protein